MGFRKKMCTFCFCLFYDGKSKKEQYETNGKGKLQKKTEKLCFWVVVKKNGLFIKMSFLET